MCTRTSARPFFATNVLSFVTEGREFHYGAVGQPPEHWLPWGSTSDPFDLAGGARVMRSVELLLNPVQLLSILRDFTLFDRPVRDWLSCRSSSLATHRSKARKRSTRGRSPRAAARV